jgi:hypothetical protein
MPVSGAPASQTAAAGSGFITSGLIFEKADRHAGHDGGYGVFVDELRQAITPQENAEIVEPGDDSLQFYSVYEENGDCNFIFSDVI